MAGPEGEENCSECGLFWMYHKMKRPLGVGVGIDVVGPKRETRGPKIMDSRKRRLGSVNTGSGSESEQDEAQMDDEKADSVKEEEMSDVRVDTPEPPDDSPISLVNLTVLARKIQCTSIFIMLTSVHFQELSSLNSPLLHHPSIISLRTVVDSLIPELSPLSIKDLSSFTRSTLSFSVIQNLLAHVTAAEAETYTSDEERRDAVSEVSWGPDEPGDLLYQSDPSNKDAMDAAKGLVNLHEITCNFAFLLG
jgi:hypothetical protein